MAVAQKVEVVSRPWLTGRLKAMNWAIPKLWEGRLPIIPRDDKEANKVLHCVEYASNIFSLGIKRLRNNYPKGRETLLGFGLETLQGLVNFHGSHHAPTSSVKQVAEFPADINGKYEISWGLLNWSWTRCRPYNGIQTTWKNTLITPQRYKVALFPILYSLNIIIAYN